MQTEILSDLREARGAMADAKEKLDVMNVSLMGYIIDSIREYNEAYEKNYILSTEDVVKQPKKRKPGRPKGKSSAGANREKLIEFLRINGPDRKRVRAGKQCRS